MYKIIGADQQEYGPVSADDIRQWIAEGRANGQTSVQMLGDSTWRPLASCPEFAAALGASPLAAAPPILSGSNYSQLPADILQRDYDVNLSAYLSQAWRLVMDNFGMMVGGTAIYLLIQFAFNAFGRIPLLGIMSSLVSFVVMGPLLGGLHYFILKNIRREPVDVGDVFSGFKLRFLQLMLTYIIQGLIACAVAIPGAVIMLFGLWPLFQNHEPDGTQIGLIVIGFIVLIIPMMFLSVSWIFSLTLVIDKQLDFWQAMETSRKVVGKHWWLVFVLLIVVGLVTAAGLFACCIGIFVSAAIGITISMYAYEDIFGQRTGP